MRMGHYRVLSDVWSVRGHSILFLSKFWVGGSKESKFSFDIKISDIHVLLLTNGKGEEKIPRPPY